MQQFDSLSLYIWIYGNRTGLDACIIWLLARGVLSLLLFFDKFQHFADNSLKCMFWIESVFWVNFKWSLSGFTFPTAFVQEMHTIWNMITLIKHNLHTNFCKNRPCGCFKGIYISFLRINSMPFSYQFWYGISHLRWQSATQEKNCRFYGIGSYWTSKYGCG